MPTIVEKIIAAHAGDTMRNIGHLGHVPAVKPGDIAELSIDVRLARDFGGANVIKNLEENGLGVADPAKTFFTFDCNPTASDQKYAANQQACRLFARNHDIKVYDEIGRAHV